MGYSLNPLKRVNSILTKEGPNYMKMGGILSQSPQTGQFNSYGPEANKLADIKSARSQSPQTGQFNSYTKELR